MPGPRTVRRRHRLRLAPSAGAGTRAAANARDAAWLAGWRARGRALYTEAGKVAGKVLHVGDSLTNAFPYAYWTGFGSGMTAEDAATLSWCHATPFNPEAGQPDEYRNADSDNGFYLATVNLNQLGGRAMTAAGGLTAASLLSGSGNGGTAMPAVTSSRAAARTTIASATYTSNIHVDTLIAAFSDAQLAVLLFSGIPADKGTTDLATICTKLEAAGILPILSTMTPRHVAGDADPFNDYNDTFTIPYNADVRALARARGYPLIDLYVEAIARRPGTGWYGTLVDDLDGIHLTASGAGYDPGSDPYADGGDPATHRTGAACRSVGYLLRGWLSVGKLAQVKAEVADAAAGSGPGVVAPVASNGAPPAEITAKPLGPTRVRIAWKVLDFADSEFVVEGSDDGGSSWSVLGRPTASLAASPDSFVWDDTTIPAGSTRAYRIWRDADYGAAPDGGAPWHLRATVDGYFAGTVLWDAQPGATTYVLQRLIVDDGGTWATVATQAGTTFAITPAVTSTHGYLGFRVFDQAAGVGAASAPITVSFPTEAEPLTTPAAGPWTPDGLYAAPLGPTTAEVGWCGTPLATGYEVQRSPAGAGAWSAAYSGAATSFADSGLAAGTAYDYRVRAAEGAAVSTWGPTVAAEATPTPSAGRRLLQPADFTYLGSFLPPDFADPPTDAVPTGYSGGGVAVRTVGGQARAFLLTSGAGPEREYLLEVAVPAPAASAPFPKASLVRYWGSPYGTRALCFADDTGLLRHFERANGGKGETAGIDYDPATGLLWWSNGEFYNGVGSQHPTVGRCLVDDGTPALVPDGPWRLDPAARGFPHERKTRGGSLKIPQWFADAHLGAAGAPFRGVGMGGGYSITTPASAGPCLFAVPESAFASGAACVAGQSEATAPKVAAVTPLVAFQYGSDDASIVPATRQPGYRQSLGAALDPDPGTPGLGTWQWTDFIFGAAAWVDNPAGTRTRHGLVYASSFAYGDINYKGINFLTGADTGGTCYDGGLSMGFAVLDPADLAAVAAGGDPAAVAMHPAAWWTMPAPTVDRRSHPYAGDFLANHLNWHPNGMAFDPVAGRLYVAVAGPEQFGGGLTRIDVYAVA